MLEGRKSTLCPRNTITAIAYHCRHRCVSDTGRRCLARDHISLYMVYTAAQPGRSNCLRDIALSQLTSDQQQQQQPSTAPECLRDGSTTPSSLERLSTCNTLNIVSKTHKRLQLNGGLSSTVGLLADLCSTASNTKRSTTALYEPTVGSLQVGLM